MNKKSFTFIELTVVIVITGILSVGSGYLLAFIVQSTLPLSEQLAVRQIAADVMRVLIEGDAQAKGLRFSKRIVSVQPAQITFTDQDSRLVVYRWDSSARGIFRSIDGGPEMLVPYFSGHGFQLTSKNNVIFTYFDGQENITSQPSDVKLVKICVSVGSVNGYMKNDTMFELVSAVSVYRYLN